MIWINYDFSYISGVPADFEQYLISMVKDLEDTRAKYNGYSYVRTMRNILIGKNDAAIAPFFVEKKYYGLFSDLMMEECEKIMDTLVSRNKIEYVITDHGKLYCTKDYHDYLCRKNK